MPAGFSGFFEFFLYLIEWFIYFLHNGFSD
jgi:hypothetical protein